LCVVLEFKRSRLGRKLSSEHAHHAGRNLLAHILHRFEKHVSLGVSQRALAEKASFGGSESLDRGCLAESEAINDEHWQLVERKSVAFFRLVPVVEWDDNILEFNVCELNK
jgi:hypothetical protein